MEGGGNDQKNLLVVNAVPVNGPDALPPPGERAGRFVVSPEPHSGADSAKGTDQGSAAGSGSGPADVAAGGAVSEHGVATGDNGVGAGSLITASGHDNGLRASGTPASGGGNGAVDPGSGIGSGTGVGSAAGSAGGNSPFKGITIVGGATGSGSHRDSSASRAHSATRYGLTIIGSGPSGGGLKDYGVFHHETVYTVYLGMADMANHALDWTMQYALMPAERGGHPGQPGGNSALQSSRGLLAAPYPVAKRIPEFRPELLARYRGRMVVVAAQIDKDGKLRDIRFVQSVGPELNPFIEEALSKWEFHPAAMDYERVGVKVLLGIPVQ